VKGPDLLGQLDRARRKQDAEAIMAFIAMVERHMRAHAEQAGYRSPYLEEQRRRLAEEYLRQEAVHREIARQLPSATTPARARAEAAEAALREAAASSVEAGAATAAVGVGAGVVGGSPF
jgi:hypothetical protein